MLGYSIFQLNYQVCSYIFYEGGVSIINVNLGEYWNVLGAAGIAI